MWLRRSNWRRCARYSAYGRFLCFHWLGIERFAQVLRLIHIQAVLVRYFADHSVVWAEALNFVVRCFHVRIWKYHHQAVVTLFNASNQCALFIQKE